MANFATKTPKIVTLAVLALASASDERTNRNNQKRWYVAQGSKCYFTLANFSAETPKTMTLRGRKTNRNNLICWHVNPGSKG
jgi:hypothetical protein